MGDISQSNHHHTQNNTWINTLFLKNCNVYNPQESTEGAKPT